VPDEESRWGAASLQRRKHPRLDVSLPVEFVVRGPAWRAGPGRAATRSVGGGGLLLILAIPMAVGTPLALTLYLPAEPGEGAPAGPRAIRAEALVAWADLVTEGLPDECRCGVAFTDIQEADRQAILGFIARARSM
jgi:c-di-GMP-binding flagellar brake protein YcgR